MREVQSLLAPSEFVSRAMAAPGIPWVRWRSDWAACDCFGLIVLWFREVLGVELGDVPETEIAAGFAQASGWEECGAEEGATAWMAWRDGAPTHCGILLRGAMLLHSEASPHGGGGVRLTRLSAAERVYGPLRFYRYSPC
jgi:cell wall-associated NlpC family hydrolase